MDMSPRRVIHNLCYIFRRTNCRYNNVHTVWRGELSETFDDAKSGDEFYDDSIMPPLISEEEMDAMDIWAEYDAEPMSTDTLEDIRDGSESHLSVNRRDKCYKIRDRIKIKQTEWKGVLLSKWNMGKGLQKSV